MADSPSPVPESGHRNEALRIAREWIGRPTFTSHDFELYNAIKKALNDSAEASARSARAEALAALEPFANEAVLYDDAPLSTINPDCRLWQIPRREASLTVGDLRRARAVVAAIRSLKTAPKGDGDANAGDTAPARQP